MVLLVFGAAVIIIVIANAARAGCDAQRSAM
jgi:hypothetical protein